MLYFLGAVAIDARPFSIDGVERTAGSSIVAKPIMGGRMRKEVTGEGEDDIVLSGVLLPSRIGGLDELEVLHGMRRRGARFPLMRGDGYRYESWYMIREIRERHADLMRNGVGFTVEHTITLEQAEIRAGDGNQVISGLLSLFDALGVV